MKDSDLRNLISEEVRRVLAEDYARGIPDFVLDQVADIKRGLKQYLTRHTEMVSQDALKSRKMYKAADAVLKEIEVELKELMEDKLRKFFSMV